MDPTWRRGGYSPDTGYGAGYSLGLGIDGGAFRGTQDGGRVYYLDPGWRVGLFPGPQMEGEGIPRTLGGITVSM